MSAALLIAFCLSVWVFSPLTRWVFPDTTVPAIVVYLPHGVRVVGAWLYGWSVIPYLLVGQAILFVAGGAMDLSLLHFSILFVVYLVTPPLAFHLLAVAGFDIRGNPALRYNWRSVVFAGALASTMNAVALHIVRFKAYPAEEHLVGIFYLVLGDLIGLVAVLAGILVVSRRFQRIDF